MKPFCWWYHCDIFKLFFIFLFLKMYQNLHQKDHDQLYSSFLLWLGYFSIFIIYSQYSLSYDWPRCWNIILFLQTKCKSIIMMWLQAILNRYICWAWICISFKPNMMVPSNASGQVPLDINISCWPSVSSSDILPVPWQDQASWG